MAQNAAGGSEKDISLKDAIALKHSINKALTYGGMNARELVEFKRVDWPSVKLEYEQWQKKVRILSGTALTIFFLFGVGLYFLLGGWWRSIGIVLIIYSVLKTVWREGQGNGYMEGYEAGFDAGINKVLGVSPNEDSDISDRAIEMEMDEMILKS